MRADLCQEMRQCFGFLFLRFDFSYGLMVKIDALLTGSTPEALTPDMGTGTTAENRAATGADSTAGL